MRFYDPSKPLVFLHLPRTGGTALVDILRGWFGKNRVYRNKFYDWDDVARFPGSVYRGHWSETKGFNVEKMIRGEAQFFTFLRNPLDRLPSIYSHFKERRRYESDHGRMTPMQFAKRNPPSMLERNFFDNMPAAEYPAFFETFVFVGLTERYQESVDRLADILGKPRVVATVRNASAPRRFTEDEDALYREMAQDELRIYEAVARTWEQDWRPRFPPPGFGNRPPKRVLPCRRPVHRKNGKRSLKG